MTEHRRFPAPWTFDEANHACFIVRDGNRFPVAYVYLNQNLAAEQQRIFDDQG